MGLPKVFSTFEYEIENPHDETFKIIKDTIQQVYIGKKIKSKKDKWGFYFKTQTSSNNPIFFGVECFKDGVGTYLRLKIGSHPQKDKDGNVSTQTYHYDVLNRILKFTASKLRIIQDKKVLTCPLCGKRKDPDARFCSLCADDYWSQAADETSQHLQSFLIENVFKSESRFKQKINTPLNETVKVDEDENTDTMSSSDEEPEPITEVSNVELIDEILNCPRCGAYIDEKFQLLYQKGYDIYCEWCNFIIKKKYKK
ncbi:MAG: hypothetical protein ACTSVY_01045 [Candidatus Helarchaeota archaeon]